MSGESRGQPEPSENLLASIHSEDDKSSIHD